ncbi:ribosome biogenesis protein [Candidatus Micrarchaeota archaeon]|nr:ribosome biogenesis protein [Candidatus Micrarchaeota archaeon]
MKKMRFCESCSSYTLLSEHCGKLTISAHPPKFKPADPYGKYRRRLKYGV